MFAVAFAHATLYADFVSEASERYFKELVFLERIAKATASSSNHTALLNTIVAEATEAVATEVCSIYLWDDTEKALTLTATNGLSPQGIGRVKIGLGEGVTGWVAAQRKPVAIRDVRYDALFSWVPGLDQEQLTSMLSVPIVSANRLVGVINLQTVQPRIFSEEEIEFLSAVAAQVAGIIELSWLHQKASRELALEREVAGLLAINAKDDPLRAMAAEVSEPIASARMALKQLSSRLRAAEQRTCEEIDESLQKAEFWAGKLGRYGHPPLEQTA